MTGGRTGLAAERLRNSRISGPPLADAEAVLCWLGAVQAQEYAVAKWSLGQRTTGATEAGLDAALAAGSILRTHLLRPTWHFVLPADIRWLVGLTAPRVQALNAHIYRKVELDGALLGPTAELFAEALRGGVQLTRRELQALLARHGIVATGLRLAYLLMNAELELVVCSGGLKGRQHTYALLEERVPPTPALDREEALAELTRRYFTSRGPATARDFAQWASLTLTHAKRGLELVGDELDRRVVGDRTYWSVDSPEGPPRPAPTADLLQGYDEYVMAYGESRDLLDEAGVAGVVPGGAAMFTHALLLDGQVVGHWRRKPTSTAMTVEVQPGRPLDAAERAAVDAAVGRYADFVGVPASWS